MENKSVYQMPTFMKEEMENLKQAAAPILKKRMIFLLTAIPLVIVSIVYLSTFWGQTFNGMEMTIKISIATLGAAFGMALFRESSYQKRYIRETVVQYILERMQKSEVLSSERKNQYVRTIKEQPFSVMNSFIEFLNEEENRRRRLSEE
ncbi:DUF5392 family protein [Bacillus changyiensis]|uniref:DUF5392 family protein n=1 Tax=Bacillus changyiensis TaxID=3004103 RepID=UPI0022DF3224|nr:DUF5392 family protein [Bacillus changyiensis]MDA1476660.1 DUF5392 family protein [Bacillus changyiensis]